MKPLLLAALSLSLATEYPQPNVREEQVVDVSGTTEIWQLRWAKPPHPSCVAEDPGAFSCPCRGFAYAEAGPLELVRIRKGKEIDRLPIRSGLIEMQGDEPMLQRAPTTEDDIIVQRWQSAAEGEAEDPNSIRELVARRAPVQIMHFEDYDHDGGETEFFLQTSATPCGRNSGVVIGVSKNEPTLHVFGTVQNRFQPLYLPRHIWEKLATATRSFEIVDMFCGDAGAKTETTVHLGWSLSGITSEPKEYTCPGGFKSGRLIL
jgi:hypothetical protein